MQIKEITLKNFKNIKDFNQTFEGDVYLVTGENERGKSSVIQSIMMLLKGEKDASVLTRGKDKGFAEMKVEDVNGVVWTVSLSYTEKNPLGTFKVTDDKGMTANTKEFIQRLFGYTDFDAVEFVSWGDTKEGRARQVKEVESVMDADCVAKIHALTDSIAAAKEERKDINREVAKLSKIAEEAEKNLPENPERYTEKKTATDLLAKIEERTKVLSNKQKAVEGKATREQQIAQIPVRQIEANETANAARKSTDRQRAAAIKRCEELKAQAEAELAEALKELTAKDEEIDKTLAETLAKIESDRAEYEQRLQNCINYIKDVEESGIENQNPQQELSEIESHNAKVEMVAKCNQLKAEYESERAKADALSAKIKDLEAEKAETIKAAKIPVEGLEFGEDGLLLNGVPFRNGSTSDSQNIEVATKLVMAANPTTKVFRIARGESLGAKRLKDIVTMARANGYQGFIEQVERNQAELIIKAYEE